MKVIIAGSRTIINPMELFIAISESGFRDEITEVVSGCARGVDSLGMYWATTHGIPVTKFPANWDQLGRSAGILRNIEMAKYADALIAVTNGSKGTAHMIQLAQEHGLKVFVRRM